MNTMNLTMFHAGIAVAISSVLAPAMGMPPRDGRLPLASIQVITMPGLDYDLLDRQDAARAAKGAPVRIAVPNAVRVEPRTSGTWEYLDDGRMMWRILVFSPGAAHLNFGFERLALPSSASMTISSLDGSDVTDTLTDQTPLSEGQYWSRIVWGDEVVIACVVDADQRQALADGVSLAAINEGYRGLRAGAGGASHTSDACNVDVACSQGDDWSCEIPSVGVYTVDGSWACTGAMINNTSEDQTPYFLTAQHCGVTTANDQSVVIYWNYENSTCRTPGSGESAAAGDGGLAQTSSGTTALAESADTDFTLLELTSSPPASYGVSFAGWSRSTSLPTVGSGIHHPNTAEKRISIPATVTHDPDPVYSDTFWEVVWSQGVTEPGSSGAPLFNGEHQIIGQLFGGESFCAAPTDPDWYGKSIAASWSEVSAYLDPGNSGVMSLDTLCEGGSCQWAITGGTSVGVADLQALLDVYGQADANADFDDSGVVDVGDLLQLLEHWGVCSLP